MKSFSSSILIKILISILCSFLIFQKVSAEEKILMNYTNEDITKVIEQYSKAAKQKFVVDPSVRGKITLFIQEPISLEEAFNQLSTALAINSYAISKQDDTMVVKTARNIQRDLIEVSKEKPSIKPERMYTWIYSVQHISAENINRDLRILLSKDGEMSVYANTNQLIITDWVTNINRVALLLAEIDKPIDSATSKIINDGKKEREHRKK